MQNISLEYCHVTPDTDWEAEIIAANKHTQSLLQMFPDFDVQKCIMVDDLHSKTEISKNFIDEIIDKLVIKPDCIYLESSFVLPASQLAANLNPQIASLTIDNSERVWLKKIADTYNSTNDFLFSWKKSDGTIMFSCPTLVATSYLYRLGKLNNHAVLPIYGNIRPADKLLNLLSSQYIQVEANAQLILKAYSPQILQTISWHFY